MLGAQRFRVTDILDVLAKDWTLITSTHVVTHNPQTPVPGI